MDYLQNIVRPVLTSTPFTATVTPTSTTPTVLALAVSPEHKFTKRSVSSINLLPGLGVEGDCHSGVHVQHRSRLHIQPPPANLRQVHLIQNEILQDCRVKPGDIGENITTTDLDLLGLGVGTKLHFLPVAGNDVADGDLVMDEEDHPVIVITGLRNACPQIEKFCSGLQEKFVVRDAQRKITGRKAGVMSTVERGGTVRVGMRLAIELPETHKPLECV